MSRQDDALWEWFRDRLNLTIVRKAICPHHSPPFDFFADAFYERQSMIIGLSSRTGGKAIQVDTPVLTTEGWSTMGALKLGDQVFGPDGLPTYVLWAGDAMWRPTYEVLFSTGIKIIADAEHLWQIEGITNKKILLRTTEQIAASRLTYAGVKHFADEEVPRSANCSQREWMIRATEPVQQDPQQLPIPPYTLGIWLGDGTRNTSQIGCWDPEIIAKIETEWPEVVPVPSGDHLFSIRGLITPLKALGVDQDKHVPEIYHRGSIEQRLELLRGLMDSDGSPDKQKPRSEFCSIDERLARDVYRLVSSLGGLPRWLLGRSKLNGHDYGPRYRVIFGSLPVGNHFFLPRKAELVRDSKWRRAHRLSEVNPVGDDWVRCIKVARSDGMFLIGDALVATHNTLGVAALNVAEMSLKPGCGIVSLAGNFAQAQRGYQYVVSMIKADRGLASKLDGPPLQKRTKFVNGANLEILTASERSVHSPHVPKLRIDEVDLVPEEIYQGALSIPISTPYAKAGVVMTSTRFKAYGMMYRLIEDAHKTNTKVHSWCCKDTMARCPYHYKQCPMRACEGFCDGKSCKRADGYLKVDDIFDKFMGMDEETWRTQWLVEKPSRFGLVYDVFDANEHVVRDEDLPPHFRLDPYKLPGGAIRWDFMEKEFPIKPRWDCHFDWIAGVDWGYEDPFVMLLAVRTPNDDVIVLDELVLKHHTIGQCIAQAAQRFPMLIARPNDTAWTEHEIAPVYPDPSDPAGIQELQMRNFLAISRPYKIPEGISLVRRFFRPPGAEKPKLFVHARCEFLIKELNSYHLKENSDVPAPGDDHSMDALRYLMQGTFMPSGVVVTQSMTWSPTQTPIAPDLNIEIPGLAGIDDW